MVQLNSKWDWVDTSAEQFQEALHLLLETDENVLLMGPGGTGKSVLLQIIYDHFRNVLVMGPTGISAANLSTDGVPATTIHAALGLPPLNVYSTFPISQKAINLVSRCSLILIDEISMVPASLMDFLLRVILSSSEFVKPRIIIFGDIFQLPPVRSDDITAVRKYYQKQYDGNYFFFNARLFKKFNFKMFHLDEIYRQKDPIFKEALNRIRMGICTEEDLALINTRVVNKEEFLRDKEYLLYLATTNAIVNKLNDQYTSDPRFTEKQTYYSQVSGNFNLFKHPGLSPQITLAVGQQVMCTANDQEGQYQNGTLGIVLNVYKDMVRIRKRSGDIVYVTKHKWDKYEYKFDEKLGEVTYEIDGSCEQIGCKPAYAVTFHKSQGLTLDSIFIDMSSHFVPESGVYLALSRCRTLEGIGLSRPITQDDIVVSAEALEYIIETLD